MKWRKLGRIFEAAGQRPWMQSHCSMPFAERADSDTFRLWFSPRDAANRSHIAWLEIDIRNPETILRISETPVLAPTSAGAFDYRGAAASCITEADKRRRLYYIGWSDDGRDPYHIAIGLAESQDGGLSYVRHPDNPVLDRNAADPTMVSTPYVLPTDDGWRMWYLSVTDWPDPTRQPHYDLRQAVSADGLTWQTDPTPCVTFHHPTEIAIARPSVLKDGETWRMWFCHRGTDYAYRIGYAESSDGVNWSRRDEQAGITVSKAGWDSEMVAYPHVFDHGGNRYMLYSGNGFGRGGMGLAVLEQD
jgi:predicted GH43/DUF377 family glycosyl hydrolase